VKEPGAFASATTDKVPEPLIVVTPSASVEVAVTVALASKVPLLLMVAVMPSDAGVTVKDGSLADQDGVLAPLGKGIGLLSLSTVCNVAVQVPSSLSVKFTLPMLSPVFI
jgi:hypothetical protein